MIKMSRRAEWRWEGRLFLTLTVVYLLFLAAFSDWEGGWSMGPRHLVPLLPFLATGVIYGLANTPPERRGGWGTILAVGGLISIGFTFLGTVTFPYFPKEFPNPLYELARPLLGQARLAPTLGELLGLRGWVRLLSLAVPAGLLAAVFLRDAAWFATRRAGRRAVLIAGAVLVAGLLLWVGTRTGRRLEEKLSPEEKMLREAQRNRVLYFMEREEEGRGGE